jgi:probable HAF family extracellular repeat protein
MSLWARNNDKFSGKIGAAKVCHKRRRPVKSRTLTCITAMTVFGAIALPARLVAQGQQQAPPHYTITDLGTLGGTSSFGRGLNNKGLVVGISHPLVKKSRHAFLWRKGVITDLGTLGGPNSGPSFSPFSERGEVGGGAETTAPDPNGEDFCFFGTQLTCLPVVWHDGAISVLPTLGGNNGVANQVNNRGQTAGVAESTTLVSPCLPPLQGLAEPVIWEGGQIQELPMFPGDQAGTALAINDKGQAVGFSATCTIGHPLIWQNGTATNLGSLGGTFGVASAINNQGQVAGQSNLRGDTTAHAFLWQKGIMTDLGTLAGDFLSDGLGINSRTQVVGVSCDVDGNCRPFLWEGGVMMSLNDLIPAGSPWFLFEADTINSRGEIVGGAFNTNTFEVHGFLATPSNGEPVSETATAAGGEMSQRPKVALSENVRKMLRQRLTQRYHIRGLGALND